MLILAIMVAGGIIGYIGIPKKAHLFNCRLQVVFVAFLIFAMGVSLGARDGFFGELAAMGWDAFVLSWLPIIGSTLLVYVLTQRFLPRKEKKIHGRRSR